MTENPTTSELNDKKDDLFPAIDLLTLAEERAASAPITEFGVTKELKSSLRIVHQTKTAKYWQAKHITNTITPDLLMLDSRNLHTTQN